MTTALAIHGGAGLVRKHSLTPEREAACRAVLAEALVAGAAILDAGGDALDACIAAVVVLEDSPLFNAGRGAVFAADGSIQHDASVMHGRDRSGGGVAAVSGLKNPVRAAELVRTRSPHVLMAGDGAVRFCAEHGAEVRDAAWFFDAERWAHLERARAAGRTALDHELEDGPAGDGKGTVGAVALDAAGNLAAATSTGGVANKLPGRVGDSPILGAGTFAWNATCAVSATGEGEKFLRGSVAARVSAWMELGGLSLAEATQRVVDVELAELRGLGGLIAIDRQGRISMPFNSAGMYRGYFDTERRFEIEIW